MRLRRRPYRKPPRWFRWSILAGMLLAVAAPAACVVSGGAMPGAEALAPG